MLDVVAQHQADGLEGKHGSAVIVQGLKDSDGNRSSQIFLTDTAKISFPPG